MAARRKLLVPLALCASALVAGIAPHTASSEETGVLDGGASLATEASRRAADSALRWLVNNQQEDGAWLCDIGSKLNEDYLVERQYAPHVGVTALAGTAFLASGSVPGRGPYAKNLERALDYVLRSQDERGFISSNGTRMYSHAFATMFLAEVYGMTHDRKVRDALQRAVEFTYKSQNQQGGWRYVPNAEDSDMSITVCQVVAMRAAKNKGIAVPKESVDAAVEYVIKSAVTRNEGPNFEPGAFKYQYQSKNNAAEIHTRTSFALTAAGVTTLYGAGIYDDLDLRRFAAERGVRKNPMPRFEDMLRYIQNHYSDVASGQHHEHYFYYYGNYYAVQAMFIAGDPWWSPFYKRLRDDLVRRQRPDGAWNSNVGDAYSTAVGAIVLQVPNNYLPIFQR